MPIMKLDHPLINEDIQFIAAKKTTLIKKDFEELHS